MAKNILVLTGSPRVGGNSDAMADAFINGAKAAGHQVNKFEAGIKQINGCKACDACFSKDTACVFNDDFNTLAEYIEHADAVVFATPLYWFSFPSGIKAAIDKLYSFDKTGKEMNIKESMLLVCGATDDKSDFDGIIKSYELIAKYKEWKDLGHYIVKEVDKKGDILSSNVLNEIENLGRYFNV
jgi:multimeric flavodoxin WrbA